MRKKISIFLSVMFLFSLLVSANSSYAVATATININTATVEKLQELPGVGPVTAQRIVDYREKSPFSSPEELMEIKGIGQKTFAKLKDMVRVE